jgi:serine/threonine-protein kinase
MEYIQKHVMEPPILLNQRVPERQFPPGLQDVLATALAKKPEERFQSAAEFAAALKSFGGARSGLYTAPPAPMASSPGPPPTAPLITHSAAIRPRPGPGLLIGVAAFCLIAGVLLAFVLMRVLGQ